jgi:hypothetical protein
MLTRRMSIIDAINRGVTNVVGKSVHFAPNVVTDTVTGEKLTLDDAIKNGLIDVEGGLFTDKSTGEEDDI